MARKLNVVEIANIRSSVERSSRQVIKDTLLELKDNLSSNIWVKTNNKYLIGTIAKIKNDEDDKLTSIRKNPNQLREYIAISSILHCKDGWDYLSTSLSALSEGNISNAIHLAYYAELRAAMSFLASDGIGVFSNIHYWIDDSLNCNRVLSSNIGTHDFVWATLNQWSNVQSKKNNILNIISVNRRSIFDWLVSAGMPTGGSTTMDLAKDWLKIWSLDLETLLEDHNIRNEVSYRPQEIKRNLANEIKGIDNLKLLSSKWLLCEPTEIEKFRYLDYYLLKSALNKYYRNNDSLQPRLTKQKLNKILESLAFTTQNKNLEDFLLNKTKREMSHVFNTAKNQSLKADGRINANGIICRAFLLLRLSTAFVNDSFKYAGYNKSDLEFWWKDIGEKQSLWDSGNEPNSIIDLWQDVVGPLTDIRKYIGDNPTATNFKLQFDLSKELSELKKFQRVHLWGVGL